MIEYDFDSYITAELYEARDNMYASISNCASYLVHTKALDAVNKIRNYTVRLLTAFEDNFRPFKDDDFRPYVTGIDIEWHDWVYSILEHEYGPIQFVVDRCSE